MRVLVSGASGFIGSHIAEELAGQGHEVVCLVRKTSNVAFLKTLPVERRVGDLSDRRSLAAVVDGCQAVVHSAAQFGASRSQDMVAANDAGTENLVAAVVDRCPDLKQFIQISSLAAAGATSDKSPANEAMEPTPCGVYGHSKRKAELHVLAQQDRFPVTIVRPSITFGPRDLSIYHFFKTLRRHIRPIPGTGRRHYNFFHVKDLVQGVLKMLGNPKAYGELFYLGAAENYSWIKLTDTMLAAIGTRAIPLPIPPLAFSIGGWMGDAVNVFSNSKPVFGRDSARLWLATGWCCDIAKAQEVLGYQPTFDLASGLKDTYQWYLDAGWL